MGLAERIPRRQKRSLLTLDFDPTPEIAGESQFIRYCKRTTTSDLIVICLGVIFWNSVFHQGQGASKILSFYIVEINCWSQCPY